MKKRIIAITLALMCMLVLAGCGCDHEWEDPDCTTPKTCSECGETKGEALGHDWEDATCEEPQTCKDCGKTKGKPLPHTWEDATCEEPQTCSVCGETDGEPLGHSWLDATYDAPKTCSVCGATEGEPLEPVASDFSSSAVYNTICEVVRQYMGDLSPAFEYDPESQVMYISLTAPEGTAAALATNPAAMAESWQTMRVSFCDFCNEAQNLVDSNGYPEVSCCILMLNDANTENVLLGIMYGEVVYDVMAE